jgi:hypothetical protein
MWVGDPAGGGRGSGRRRALRSLRLRSAYMLRAPASHPLMVPGR